FFLFFCFELRGVSKRVSTVLVGPTAWVREGIASILQNTPYKVEAVASEPAELAHVHYPVEKRTLAIIGANGNRRLDDAAACIRLLRSCMPGGKLVLIAEISEPIVDREWLSSADACIVNLRSREILMKVLELTFLDQRVLVSNRKGARGSLEGASSTLAVRSDEKGKSRRQLS